MSYKSVHFDDGRPNVLGTGDPQPAPRIRVDVKPPAGSSLPPLRFMGLLDTGASHLFLPTAAATRLGIPLTGSSVTPVQIWTANGIVTMHQRSIDVAIHGNAINGLDAIFFPNQRVLVGRNALFKFLEAVGFESGQWMIKYPPQWGSGVTLSTINVSMRPDVFPSNYTGFGESDTHVISGAVRLKKKLW